MTLVQPALELAHTQDAPFSAVVARQLSVWPFAARTTRLFVLIDPSLPDPTLRRGLLRAVQQAYFASDGYSQTRAVREAALAAHYVLRHRNRDVLPVDQVNAASAVAAVRGETAIVALAGHAAAFTWRDGHFAGQHGILRLSRPLGLEQDPPLTLWSAPLCPPDRLVLVCGATWQPDSPRMIHDILARAQSAAAAEQQLAAALGDSQPAGVLVVSPDLEPKPARHLRLLPPGGRTDPDASRKLSATPRKAFPVRQWLTTCFGVALLAAVVAGLLTLAPESPRDATPAMVQLATAAEPVNPQMAVQFGPSGANVIDLAVGNDALYTLDVSEAAVRSFALDALDQQPTPNTLLARSGMPLDSSGRRLADPVAIQYVPGGRPELGSLAVIDQARTVVQIGHDRGVSLRSVPASSTWQALGALGSDSAGDFFFLDSGSRRLLEYSSLSQPIVQPPRLVVDASADSSLAFERVAEVVAVPDSVVLRLDDGSLRRLDANGDQVIDFHAADGSPVRARSATPDRSGGLFIADPANARVLQASPNGDVIRELRDPALSGIRLIQSSLDGRRLFGLVASGVLVFDIPA